MDTNELVILITKLDEQQKKMDQIFVSVEKTRNYFKWTLIISIAVIVLPAIGLMFAIPAFLNTLQIPAGLGL
ncbi:MAG: hypothetical protein ACD_81C00180G0003 [uncultured bacterium]|uniref:Uncharacterized protein n=2 Tax=Candidatus Wolfeibacteriota TaxID=1752735 RepID=A0A0G1JIT2_9BACT|nr:MAG: hypothetical protein ACD_81C00180G0003 [uncultured bacterium]KKR12959.1 MAG: hypothetical protein UT41_C0001G0503 [Candidatus Wolfebacteria bacterium GW2011_GWC2_39_22]KKT43887.1 MAG: hypothetical protein UW32_C0001G0479 [Candidatus Wolfebacteria bacterium GW2011_GWE2_44_13]HBI25386.1 hypothetical protein [Candidatus Wolfebacteria bacterium]